MIKISKHIYIHFTCIFLIIVCWFTRKLEILSVSYFAIFLHEITHLIVAKLLGLTTSYIAFYPFGVNLKLKNHLFYELSDEILLYLSGPLFNAVLALISNFFRYNIWFEQFYWINLSLFIFNILPIVPMDGGVVLKRIASDKVGKKNAERILNAISYSIIFCLIILEFILLKQNSFNFSVLFSVIFLTANIFTNNAKYNTDFIKELLYIKNKDEKPVTNVKCITVFEEIEPRLIAKNFSLGKSYLIFKKSKNGKIVAIKTEKEIIDELISKNTS